MISDERLQEIIEDCSSLDGYADIAEMARELLALRNQPVSQPYKLPDGFVTVPIEPTRQMMSQGHFAMAGTDRGKFRRIYQAMIAAAPTDSTT